MGTAGTREEGRFEILSQPGFPRLLRHPPDIYLKVFALDGATMLYTSETKLR
jgi:hypothetical protein